MFRIKQILIIFLFLTSSALQADDAEFRTKLSKMLYKINKSILIIRQQITENQHATFLPDLHVQLGEMISQKAVVLYYIQMEKEKLTSDESSQLGKKATNEIVQIQNEGLEILNKVLEQFPRYGKRDKVYFLRAVAYKSIDNTPAFLKAVELLRQQYPQSEFTLKARVLLAQTHYDRGLFSEAFKEYQALENLKLPYERNIARYYMAQIFLRQGRHWESLQYFEKVIKDQEFKSDENPIEVSLDQKSSDYNLKREALVDSVRVFTYIYKQKNLDPVKYYRELAPTEQDFQLALEKLAFRFIDIKQYDVAMPLFRRLSGLMADVNKIIQIYREVLFRIPLNQRIALPIEEVDFLLKKFNLWFTFYDIPPKTKLEALNYFEKQIRDLATRAHEQAKMYKKAATKPTLAKSKKGPAPAFNESDQQKFDFYINKAQEFYNLHLGFFGESTARLKMAMNLADTYFLSQDYMLCGDLYLRVYQGEFGTADKKLKMDLIKDSIICLEKDKDYSFYELLRTKGLLIQALQQHMKIDPKMAKSSRVNFIVAKSRYEQGDYETAINELFAVMKRFPRSAYAISSGELILDYYNTRNDFAALMHWAGRMLELKIRDKKFLSKVSQIKKQAAYKQLQSNMEMSGEFDSFSQGKGYLMAALGSQNQEIKNLALANALENSRKEKDLATFVKAALFLAQNETSYARKSDIYQSLNQELTKATQYDAVYRINKNVYTNNAFPFSIRKRFFEEQLALLISLRHWDELAAMVDDGLWRTTNKKIKSELSNVASDLLESPVELNGDVYKVIASLPMSKELLLSLYKSQYKMSGSLRSHAINDINKMCARGRPVSEVCRWYALKNLDKSMASFLNTINKASASLKNVEKMANVFNSLSIQYQKLEGGQDAHLNLLLSLRNSTLYKAFAGFLNKAALANRQLRSVLLPKVKESLDMSKGYLKRCQQMVKSAHVATPINSACSSGHNPNLEESLTWKELYDAELGGGEMDEGYNDLNEFKKNIFSGQQTQDNILKISSYHFDKEHYSYALSTAAYGISVGGKNSKDLQEIAGCSAYYMGHYNEAMYYFKQAKRPGNRGLQCLKDLNQRLQGSD